MSTPLGLTFFKGSLKAALSNANGLCVFPSGPGLATLDTDSRYRQALAQADFRFVDSGFLALCWALLFGGLLSRLSGLRFLKAFLDAPLLKEKRSLWIHPTPLHRTRNENFLTFDKKIPAPLQTHTVAPLYSATGSLQDPELLRLIETTHPAAIVINLGSNIQEPLGAYIKNNLPYKPLILCTGGAIDFLTGAQAAIPDWADRLFLGWLFRILTTPKAQAKQMRVSPAKRYLTAFRLFSLLARYRNRSP